MTGTDEEKAAAAKKFAEINNGKAMPSNSVRLTCPCMGPLSAVMLTLANRHVMLLCCVAYEALSDEEKRRIYDAHGEEGLKQHSAGGGRQQQGGFDM